MIDSLETALAGLEHERGASARPIGGTKNDAVIVGLAAAADLVIAAWGADQRSAARAREVAGLLDGRRVLHRLGRISKNGSPRHPLYLPDATELEAHP